MIAGGLVAALLVGFVSGHLASRATGGADGASPGPETETTHTRAGTVQVGAVQAGMADSPGPVRGDAGSGSPARGVSRAEMSFAMGGQSRRGARAVIALLPPEGHVPMPPKRGVAPNSEPPRDHLAYGSAQPRIAIVIDDLGPNLAAAQRALSLDPAISFAFLPYADNLAPLIDRARRRGHDLILHMPMEPRGNGRHDPGPNALLVDLPPKEILRRLGWALARVGHVEGMNNHMGSRFTADSTGMGLVLSEAKTRGLFFLDSRTTADTVVAAVAASHGVPVLARDVFLDNVQEAEAIRAQLLEAERIATLTGQAIAIGHPYEETIAVLTDWVRDARRRGFRLVPITALLPAPPAKAATLPTAATRPTGG